MSCGGTDLPLRQSSSEYIANEALRLRIRLAMARLRSAPTAQPSATAAQPPRRALQDRTNVTRKEAPVYEDDGNTEGLVKRARLQRGSGKIAPRQENDLVMAGGLGEGKSDDSNAQSLASDELAKGGALPPPASRASRRPPRTVRKVIQDAAESKAVEDLKKRMQAATQKQTTANTSSTLLASDSCLPSSDALPSKPPTARQSANTIVQRSEYSISPSPPPPGKLSSDVKHRLSLAASGSALRASGTQAVESSILALKNFKRRPRQPSMLQMVQQRTASARPSGVMPQPSKDLSVYDMDDVEDEDDFTPEAEGTPLGVSKAKKATRSSNQKTATSTASIPKTAPGKRKSNEVDRSSSTLEATNPKRRKVRGDDLREGSPKFPLQHESGQRSLSRRQNTPGLQATSDVQVINSSPPSSTPPTEPSTSDKRPHSLGPDVAVSTTEKEPGIFEKTLLDGLEDNLDDDDRNGTLAEPASSPLPSDPLATQRTDIMADPVTQISPPRPSYESPKRKPKPVNTATLQSLLPRRRQPRRPRPRKSEYDFDSASEDDDLVDTSHLEDDEDELGGRTRRQTKTKASAKSKKGRASKGKLRASKSAASNRKPSLAPQARKSTVAPVRNKSKKTYGRSSASDKENEDGHESLEENDESVLPDTSMSMHDAAQSKELEEAKKKFAAIDEWDMEFESMSVDEHRSSSQQWR